MSSPIRRMTIRAMKAAGMSRTRRRPGTARLPLLPITDIDGNDVGIHWPRAIPKRYVPTL